MSSKASPTAKDHLSFRCDPAIRAAIEAAAEQERRPVSNLLRVVVSDWLATRGPQSGARGQAAA